MHFKKISPLTTLNSFYTWRYQGMKVLSDAFLLNLEKIKFAYSQWTSNSLALSKAVTLFYGKLSHNCILFLVKKLHCTVLGTFMYTYPHIQRAKLKEFPFPNILLFYIFNFTSWLLLDWSYCCCWTKSQTFAKCA